jgi:hypothetical protein
MERRELVAAIAEGAKHCDDCGLQITTGVPECQTLFDLVLAEHFERPVAHFGVHRLFVDTYCMQHPGRGCVSFKSFAAHAMHLCWSLERGGSRAIPNENLRRWVESHPDWQKPVLPTSRGRLTIADVAYVSPGEHHDAVSRWAIDVWSAYADLHPAVRHWVDLAFAEERPW